MRRRSKLFRPDTLERGAALFASLREVADAHDATAAQVALAWTIRHSNVVAIPGASSVEQVESNAAAADLDLHDDEIRALSDAATAVTSIGG
jgi:aryl-alcohol dehydrogenase-like predicted oxidoreductase